MRVEIISNDMPHTTREDRVMTRKDKAIFPTILPPIETPFIPSSQTIPSVIIYGNVANAKEKKPKRRKRWRKEEEEGDMASTGEGVRSSPVLVDESSLGLFNWFGVSFWLSLLSMWINWSDFFRVFGSA